jgi:hypothetical protein
MSSDFYSLATQLEKKVFSIILYKQTTKKEKKVQLNPTPGMSD